MAALPEDPTWEATIYQLEDTDPVSGGVPNLALADGMDNVPHQQLARRTSWLKQQVDTLLGSVVAATTAVAGIVRLSTSTTSTSTTMAATPSAVKAAMDAANARVPNTRIVATAGLASGGGVLSADRTIDVPKATQAEAEAGIIDTKAMTPLSVKQAISKAAADLNELEALAATVVDWNLAITNGVYKAVGAANAPINAYLLGTVEAFSATSVTQTVHVTTSDADSDTKTYRRSMDGGVWGAWYQLRISQSEQALLWVPLSRSVSASGLATGGGTLGADRTITVADATQAEAEAGTIVTKAMSPLRVAQAIIARLTARSVLVGGLATGGGTLAADRTITVPVATQAEAEAGASDAVAMTPLKVWQAVAARVVAGAVQAGSAILTSISALAANGFVVRTAAGMVAARTISAGTAINVINGDGVGGNPAIGMIVATQAEAEAGTSSTKGMTPQRVKQAITAAQAIWAYESAEQAIVGSSALTLAHGLGRVPKQVSVVMRCITAQAPYAIGDEVWIDAYVTAGTSYGVTVTSNGTNIVVRTSHLARLYMHDDAGSYINVDASKWRYVARAN